MMRCKIRHLAGLVAGAMLASQGLVLASPPPPGSGPQVTPTADGLVLEWQAPPVEITAQAGGGIGVTMRGYPQQNGAGETPLPVTSALAALPPGASPSIELLQDDEHMIDLAGSLRGAPPAISSPIKLEMAGTVRGVALARVVFYPARPAGNQLRVTTHVRVALKFNAPAPAGGLSAAAASADPVLSTLQGLVVNPGQIQPAPRLARSTVVGAQGGSGPRVAIEVSAQGITAVTYDTLAIAGLTVTVPANNLHLTRGGVEIAIQQDDANRRLLLYAAPRFSRWTTTDVYLVSQDASAGLRMTSRSADPAGLPAGIATAEQVSEVNGLYMPYCYCGYLPPGRDGDYWAWDELRQPNHTADAYPITLPAVDASQPATLTVWLIGETDVAASPDHRVSLALNSSSKLGEALWDGKLAVTATVPVPARVLQSGANTLHLALPGISGVSVEAAWFDAFSIRYARSSVPAGQAASFTGESAAPHAYTLGLTSTSGLRAYDVTDADHPQALTSVVISPTTVTMGDAPSPLPRRYALAAEGGLLAPLGLRLTTPLSTANPAGANYVIITHPDFASALAPLEALRQSQGYTVTVENAQAIYDAYSGGRPEPDAIRAYLQDAYLNWSIPPAYVLLVGDGTLDPKHYLSTSSNTFIPPYLANVDEGGGETASDNRYVVFTGTTNLPSLLIGRLPVNTLAEAQAVVGKIVRYDTQPFPYGWTALATFVAGDSDPPSAQLFAQASDSAATLVPAPFVPQRLDYTPPVWVPAIPANFIQTLFAHWDAGAGIMMYTGHASNQQWIDERLFHYDDVASLTNGPRLSVLLEMTCFTGQFDIPDLNTLDEALVRYPGGGAVAVWGATGLGLSTGHQALAAGFLSHVYRPGTTLGAAALAGKLNLTTAFDLVDTFTLLGDPAARLDLTIVPWPYNMYLPLARR